MDSTALRAEIDELRLKRRAVILAHNYQPDEIQDLADLVGDSLALSQAAAANAAEVIVFCGVDFMAESAAILAPGKKVVFPSAGAGCPLAEMADPEAVRAARAEHPGAMVVAYVNTSAAVKAEADYCCTSSNAVRVVRAVPADEIIFLPDQNLGHYVAAQVPEKRLHIWHGFCRTHHRVRAEDVERVRRAHPGAPVLVHPECPPAVVELADFVGSTSQIIRKAAEMPDRTLIIGTEMGIIHQLRKDNPDKTFYLLATGLVCPNMKKTTVEAVRDALRDLAPVVTVDESIRSRARQALERMLAVG
ncbi:MAG: quinolinate synthase NadA [Bacteroidota bacterium]